jgi:hypothetical protein
MYWHANCYLGDFMIDLMIDGLLIAALSEKKVPGLPSHCDKDAEVQNLVLKSWGKLH